MLEYFFSSTKEECLKLPVFFIAKVSCSQKQIFPPESSYVLTRQKNRRIIGKMMIWPLCKLTSFPSAEGGRPSFVIFAHYDASFLLFLLFLYIPPVGVDLLVSAQHISSEGLAI